MSNESPLADISQRTSNSRSERGIRLFLATCALLSIATTLGIAGILLFEAAKFFQVTGPLLGEPLDQTVPITDFLLGTTWTANFAEGKYGVLALVSGTIAVTIGSALIAIPLGVATAIYLSEYASPRMRSILKPALEILAGVPTVIYGFFALIYITPMLQVFFPNISLFNMVSACIVVGIMIIPMVSSISEDAMSAVPDELRQAGYGMGATKFEVATGIVVPASISGIFSSFILALSRAIGETMAVTVATGTTARLMNPLNPADYLGPAQPMTAAMVNLATGDAAGGGKAYQSLFAIGLLLFLITLTMNVMSDIVAERYREDYD